MKRCTKLYRLGIALLLLVITVSCQLMQQEDMSPTSMPSTVGPTTQLQATEPAPEVTRTPSVTPTDLPTEVPTEPADDPDLRSVITGLWEYVDDEYGWSATLDFGTNGEAMSLHRPCSYEVLSDYSIHLRCSNESEVLSVDRYDHDTLEIRGREYKRVGDVEISANDLVGLWALPDDKADSDILTLEFTEGGLLLIGGYISCPFNSYSSFASHSIEIAPHPVCISEGLLDEDWEEENNAFTFSEVGPDRLALYIGPDYQLTFSKVPGNPNLASEVVGVWECPDVTLEFTDRGKLVIADEDFLAEYQAVSGTTFLLFDNGKLRSVLVISSVTDTTLVPFTGPGFEDAEPCLRAR